MVGVIFVVNFVGVGLVGDEVGVGVGALVVFGGT